MTGISIILGLKKLKAALLRIYLLLKNPYAAGYLESGIEKQERFSPPRSPEG